MDDLTRKTIENSTMETANLFGLDGYGRLAPSSKVIRDSASETASLIHQYESPEKKSFDIWWSWFLNNGIAKPDMPSVFCWLVWKECAAQNRVQLTALRRGLAVSIFFDVILLVVVLFIIGGK